jgi:hypothetical protein
MRRFFLFGAALFGALSASNVSLAQAPDTPAERAADRVEERAEARADRLEDRAGRVEDRAGRVEDRAENAANRPLLNGNVDVQAGPGGVNVDVARDGRQIGPAGAGLNANVDRAGDNGPNGNRWRYRWHNGAWWYWTARNAWVIYQNGQWVPYETYVSTQPTYNDPTYSDPNYSGGSTYYGNSYYGPNYYGPRRYYSGYRGFYRPGYRGYYGRPIINNPGARQGAVIGGTIGGAVGGREGAAVGAGVGAAVGRGRR